MKKAFHILVYIFALIGFVLVTADIAIKFHLTNEKGIVDTQHDYFKKEALTSIAASTSDSTFPANSNAPWMKSEEWQALKQAIVKDQDAITRAGHMANISPRLIVASLIVEQLRLFFSDREIFKSYFEPLKVLGDQSQFSWGVMGLKQDTARTIENNLKDKSSPFYPGAEYEHLLDFNVVPPSTSTNTNEQRFNRLTDPNDRYYSYLYAALDMKEIESQWQKASFPIDTRPEIVATLFNIGFQHSEPNANPQVGGAEIEIATTTYSFGGLAGEFYYSGELTEEFPR